MFLIHFQTVAEGYFTNQRLKFINDTVNELYPEVKLLDPSRVNLLPLQEKLKRLENEVYYQKQQIDFTAEDSGKWKDNAENTLQDMNTLEEDVVHKIDLVNQIVSEVQSLALNIELGTGAKVDNALNEAKEILKKIKNVSFIEFRDNAVDQANQANILISEMQQYSFPASNLSFAVTDLNVRIKNISAKMDHLLDTVQIAQDTASIADKLNRENRIAVQSGNLDVVKNSTAEARQDLEAGAQLKNNASDFLNHAKINIDLLREYF